MSIDTPILDQPRAGGLDAGLIKDTTTKDFMRDVIEASRDVAVLVDFWAPWCGPCLQMAPALEAFAEANAGKVKVVKVDADDNPKSSEKYGIRSIPTLIFFKEGKPVETIPRQLSQAALQDKLNALLRT
jgi:putative thioredoxin